LLLCGCGSKLGSNQALESPQIPNYKKSETVDFDIYLDGTTSMYGYVNYPGSTIYVDAIKNIERTASENWKKETTNYIKFGDDFKKMSRDEFLQMDKVPFYDQKDTSLQKVIEQCDDKKINVIVSDLFQTNQDIDSLLMSLKNKCLSTNKALAVIGMRSQFNGKIFDVGKNLSSFDYASNDDQKSYRPFYVLVFGNENDVRHFVLSYSKKMPTNAQLQSAFFASNIGIENSMEADKLTSKEVPEKKDKKTKIAPLAEISNLVPDGHVKQYRLKTSEKLSQADIRIFSKDIIGKCPDEYSIQIDKVEQWTANGSTGQEKSGLLDKIKGSSKTKSAYSFEEIKVDNFFKGEVTSVGLKNGVANFAITLTVDPACIQKKTGKYRVNFSLIPTKEKYNAMCNVFNSWNFEDNQIGEDPATFSSMGSKTLNITKFITNLSNLNYELNQPGIHNNYVYFDVV